MRRRYAIRVRRGETGAPGRFDEFEVEATPGMTVLTALARIKAEQAPDLSYRAACRHGVCGDCAMRIQGRGALACVSLLEGVCDPRGRVRVEPLAGYPVVRDLVVDLEAFWASHRAARPWLIHEGEAPAREHRVLPDEAAAQDRADDCLLCGICSAACPVVQPNGAFPGPHALLKMYGRAMDPRDSALDERLAAAAGAFGAYRCHGAFACLDACPIGLDPATAICRLKRLAARRRDEVQRRRLRLVMTDPRPAPRGDDT